MARQAVAGEHPPDGQLDDAPGLALKHIAQDRLFEAAHVAGVAIVDLVVELFAGDADLSGVDDDDEVAHIEVRGVSGLVLTHEQGRDTRGEATEGLAGGVDDVPRLLDFFGAEAIGFRVVHLVGSVTLLTLASGPL